MKKFDFWYLAASVGFTLGLYCLYAGIIMEWPEETAGYIRTGLTGLGLGIVGHTLYKFFENVATIARNSES